ncbi:MAG: hypothetical protein ACR2LC_11655 [Pyrinomonadaceae bacterium]
MTSNTTAPFIHENLDTAFVNLAALVRYLQARKFTGHIHIELDDYDADVFLNADASPSVRETDHATGRTAVGEAALQRLLVRAREAGGLLSVYEESAAALLAPNDASTANVSAGGNVIEAANGNALHLAGESLQSATTTHTSDSKTVVDSAADGALTWDELARVSGEVIAAVERAAASAGADFNQHFRQTRLALADDYAFLDPSSGRFDYKPGGTVQLHAGKLNEKTYVSGVSECLRRVVDRISAQSGDGGNSIRERVVLELAVLARRRQTALARAQFTQQLERIAGTRVL